MTSDYFQISLGRLENELSFLPDKPEETASTTLKALWLAASGNPVSVELSENSSLPELTIPQKNMLDELIQKRITGIPLAHLTGRQSFMGIEMIAGPEALIPRKETEILAKTAIEILQSINLENLYVIDACTGVGNIAASIASNIHNTRIFASDLSESAVKLARKNAEHLNLDTQIEFFCGDLLTPFMDMGLLGKVNLLTCNPPYISSSKVSSMPEEISSHEPSLAFDGGAFGINFICRLIQEAAKFLANEGYLAFEVGLGQGNIVKKQVEKSRMYKNITTINDNQGNPRVVVAQKQSDE